MPRGICSVYVSRSSDAGSHKRERHSESRVAGIDKIYLLVPSDDATEAKSCAVAVRHLSDIEEDHPRRSLKPSSERMNFL